MKTLHITTDCSTFFNEEIKILEKKGIDCNPIGVYHPYDSIRDLKKNTYIGKYLNRCWGHNLAYYSLLSVSFYPKLLSKSISDNYDLVHLNSALTAPFGFLQPNRPIVLTIRGQGLLGDRLSGFVKNITLEAAKHADANIVRTKEMKKALPYDSHVVPAGIDLEKFKPMDQSTALKKVDWDPGKKHVLFPYPPRRTVKRYPMAKRIVDKCNSEMEIDIYMHTVSGVPHNKMKWYFNAADVLLLTSKSEGSPNTVKEAMACNLPVVSTNVGDVEERLEPVNNSYVCESELELKNCLKKNLKENKRSNGREYVKELSLDKMGDKIISIYEELI